MLLFSSIDSDEKSPGFELESEAQRVQELKNQLVKQGYEPMEIDCLITVHTENCELEGLDQDQFRGIVKALEQLLSIARNFEVTKN